MAVPADVAAFVAAHAEEFEVVAFGPQPKVRPAARARRLSPLAGPAWEIPRR
jgi:hypothetical protein